MESSPQVAQYGEDTADSSEKTDLSPRGMLHNGIIETYFKDLGHSRNSSSESSGSGSVGEEEKRKDSNSGMSELTVRQINIHT